VLGIKKLRTSLQSGKEDFERDQSRLASLFDKHSNISSPLLDEEAIPEEDN